MGALASFNSPKTSMLIGFSRCECECVGPEIWFRLVYRPTLRFFDSSCQTVALTQSNGLSKEFHPRYKTSYSLAPSAGPKAELPPCCSPISFHTCRSERKSSGD